MSQSAGREDCVHLRLVFTRSLYLYESRVERYHVVTYIHIIHTRPSSDSDMFAGHRERCLIVCVYASPCFVLDCGVMKNSNIIQIVICEKSQQIIIVISN